MFTSRIIQARSFMSFKEDYVPLKDSLKRMDYFLTLKLQKDKIAQMLIHSLVFDGRFYETDYMSFIDVDPDGYHIAQQSLD